MKQKNLFAFLLSNDNLFPREKKRINPKTMYIVLSCYLIICIICFILALCYYLMQREQNYF